MLDKEIKMKKEIMADFIRQFSKMKLSVYCKELAINKPDVYTNRVSTEKAHILADRVQKEVFLLIIEYNQKINADINCIKRIELDPNEKLHNLSIVKELTNISLKNISAEVGVDNNCIIKAQAKIENMQYVFDKIYNKMFDLFLYRE